MGEHRSFWAEQLAPASLLAGHPAAGPDPVGPRTGRDWVVDSIGVAVAISLGMLILLQAREDAINPLTTPKLAVDAACGALACLSLWWRRRWPLGVALAGVVLGTISASATIAGLLALSSLALHRSVRPVLVVAALWVPQGLIYALYAQRNDAPTVILLSVALVLAATTWGMFVRARRQLLLTLHERALRAETEQLLHADRARMAERTRIAREMHDVLAHRLSLITLHAGALEVQPDLPPALVREAAEMLRSTARQALEELRSVIGVLREEQGAETTVAAP